MDVKEMHRHAECAYKSLCEHLFALSGGNSIVSAWQATCHDVMRVEYIYTIELIDSCAGCCWALNRDKKEVARRRVHEFAQMCSKWVECSKTIGQLLVAGGAPEPLVLDPPEDANPVLHHADLQPMGRSKSRTETVIGFMLSPRSEANVNVQHMPACESVF
jgi:hypothetical protein